MENEQNILDATDYILMALNNITNYNEFLEYRDELIKAILDIKNSMTNLIKKNKTNKIKKSNYKKENKSISNQKNLKIEKDNSYLSSILGLKFNYDPYFDEKQLKDLTQNEEILNHNQTYIKNNIIYNNKNKNKNDYNKSLRNKFKSNNNNINNSDLIKSDNNNYSSRLNYTDNNVLPIKNKNQKFGIIADIIMKMNTEDYINEILIKLFGENLTDKLMSNDVSDELLEAIQNSIKEIEEYKKNDEFNEFNVKNNIRNEIIEEKPQKYPLEKLTKRKYNNDIKRSVSSKRFNKKNNNNKIYKEFNFVKSLRKNGNINIDKNDINNSTNNKYNKKEKPFICATNPYGNYFDSPLQKGGMSKLNK